MSTSPEALLACSDAIMDILDKSEPAVALEALIVTFASSLLSLSRTKKSEDPMIELERAILLLRKIHQEMAPLHARLVTSLPDSDSKHRV